MSRTAALFLALVGCAPAAQEHGGGIVSTNPCADAMLVRLVAPGRIAAISRYSHDAGATSIPLSLARRFRATAGTAEEVIALRPSLVLASTFTAAATREAYARAGLRVVYLDSPVTVSASVAQVRDVAAAVGEDAKGEAMARRIQNAVRAELVEAPSLSREKDDPSTSSGRTEAGQQPAALLYIAGDLANGAGTLLDELTRRAGFRNAAADYGLAHTGTLPTELLVAHPPAVVIATARGRTANLRRRLLANTPIASFDRNLVNCGGPTIPAALARLRAIRASL